MASDTVTDLPVRFTWERWAGPPGITMVAHLDLDRLHFEIRQAGGGRNWRGVGSAGQPRRLRDGQAEASWI